jgi:4-hydroxy-tetrahydrodipicolinate reductase
MKIALLGYGKMGKTIGKMAIERGHEIVLKIGSSNLKELTASAIKNADVAIDFSLPSTAVSNILFCFNNQVPVISGTTGWLTKYESVVGKCWEKKAAFIYGSNFSIGVNLFFELNRKLAELMEGHKQYHVGMTETHHTQKLDAPSGTAISLAKDLIDLNADYTAWSLDVGQEIDPDFISIKALREPDVPGTHEIAYSSVIDTIEIKHTAHNREGFALGAIIAAEWIIGKEGVFNMKDVLSL